MDPQLGGWLLTVACGALVWSAVRLLCETGVRALRRFFAR